MISSSVLPPILSISNISDRCWNACASTSCMLNYLNEFFVISVKIFEFVINTGGIEMAMSKIEVIAE
jgi:hypothetical protein